jgi:phosphoribosylformylglycinamidine cyclo-ligase
MCVNDVLTSGAEPLFFLDYLATGKLEASQLAAVVSGIARACRDSGCTLLGGETAEMPGFYSAGEYDLAGFCVGIVEKSQLLDGSKVQIGDVAIGLASSGVHSNGFSLVRKIIDTQGLNWQDCPEILAGSSLGEVLLTPTRLYVKPVLELLRSGLDIHAMAHITGGGIPENLPRCLGKGHSVQIYPASWPVLPIFHWLAQMGSVNSEAMFNTFNMGIGFVIIVPSDLAQSTINQLQTSGINAYQIGEVIAGKGEIVGLD